VESATDSLPRDLRFAFAVPKAEFGVADDEIVLLTLCRISPEKGIDRLLEALALWERNEPATLPRVRLFLCGAPAYMQGQKYFARLKQRANDLRMVRVHFIGHVSGERKRAFLELADLYVHLSYHESYGLTIAEAMRAGCPVLTTDHHSARDLVPPECGRIVAGRTEEIFSALREMVSDLAKLNAMGRAAAEHGRKLDFSLAAARLAAVLKQACVPAGSQLGLLP
jgi:D-inositol-3-phosphate glycosyltransferase